MGSFQNWLVSFDRVLSFLGNVPVIGDWRLRLSRLYVFFGHQSLRRFIRGSKILLLVHFTMLLNFLGNHPIPKLIYKIYYRRFINHLVWTRRIATIVLITIVLLFFLVRRTIFLSVTILPMSEIDSM